MEEKNLLKEITFLSRLIGHHKNKLKTHNLAPSYEPQKVVNRIHSGSRNLRVVPNKFCSQNLKSTASVYSKVNHSLQDTSKQSVVSEAATVRREAKLYVRKPTTVTDDSVPKINDLKQIKQNEDSSFAIFGKRSSASSSVHINPNFFTNAKSTQQEMATLRCKSVHINPRLLGAVGNKACNFDPNNTILPSELSVGILKTKVVPSDGSSKVINAYTSDSHSVSVSSQASEVKCVDSSVPLQKVANKKKYIYESKMKLVKACVNTPSGDCKLNKKKVLPANMQGAVKTIKTPHGGTLLAVSRTKLVRLPGKTRRSSSSKSSSLNISTPVTKSSYSLQRGSTSLQSSPVVRTARRVSSKYKSAAVVMMLGASSKYCLDRRLNKTPRKGKQSSCRSQYKVDHRSTTLASTPSARGTRVHSHLLISPLRKSSFSNRTWTSTPRIGQKVAISHKKLSRIGCNAGSRSQQNSALIRIGGLLYKSSRTKLILSKSSEKKADMSLRSRTIVKRRSLNAGHIVYVRGNKFVMDRSGKTLKRVTEGLSQSPSRDRKRNRVSRVDIGGVTYIQKSPSVLVRTNTHTARNVVSNAKQRSIAFLARKMRKINTPCLFYRRFGRCPRLEKGRCELVHDPKYIDICRKFLQGKCSVDGCLLSHDVGPEKMPTCRFFLEGCCVRELCPYLHVKVNDRAPICHNFLQGYCADGPECLKRHILLCPEYDKKGSCGKGKYCPYPHSIAPRVQRAICSDSSTIASEEHKEDQDDNPPPQKRKRYYETDSDEWDENLKTKRYYETETEAAFEVTQDTQSDADVSGDDLTESITERPCNAPLRKRPKIGDLPSFIALESLEFK